MSEINYIPRLTEAFSEDVVPVYKRMIPEYQKSYADYVYKGVEKEITIRKRLKNLEKSFRKMLTEVYYYLIPMTQWAVDEISHNWGYSTVDNYCHSHDITHLLLKDSILDHRFQVIRNGQFVGFAIFEENEAGLTIVAGLKPDFIGKGWGRDFFTAVEQFSREKYRVSVFILNVLEGDERS